MITGKGPKGVLWGANNNILFLDMGGCFKDVFTL